MIESRLIEKCWDGKIPVDVTSIAEQLGLNVSYKELSGIDHGELDGNTITINSNDDIITQRYTIAKEIGRHVLNIPPFRQRHLTEDLWSYQPPQEKRLYDFADHLLVPSIALKALIDVRGENDPAVLKQMFGVSSVVLLGRLIEQGYATIP